MANRVHTGDLATILEWMQEHPEQWFTSADMVKEFGLERWQVNNVFTQLLRTNRITKGERFSVGRAHYTKYRVRRPEEKREEFKVARPIPEAISEPKVEFPVLTEFDPEFLEPATKRIVNEQFSTAAQKGRVQFLNSNTFIVWNSREQHERMRRMALGH